MGDGETDGEGDGFGDGDTDGEGLGDGDTEGEGEGVGDGETEGDGDGVGRGFFLFKASTGDEPFASLFEKAPESED
ncbi:MAG: hypothetical protein ACJ763_05045 [Bdellovibrionia bacterium]